jgi:hypothetical protein
MCRKFDRREQTGLEPRRAAALVDPDHPESAGFRPMTAAADRAVMPSVTHTTDRFVVA